IGAGLLLGASIGGELLNPGAPELRTVSSALQVDAADVVARVLPLILVHLGIAMTVFWILSLRLETRRREDAKEAESGTGTGRPTLLRVNFIKAAVPLVPLVLLFLTGAPFYLVRLDHGWLVDGTTPAQDRLFDGRLIGVAMLLGVVAAVL